MSSRPKRIIKVKKKDDEIYTSICKRIKRTPQDLKKAPRRVAKKEESETNKEKNGERDLKRKKDVKAKLTDVNAAIYKRLQESLKSENDEEDTNDNEVLPKKRIPKPSFKLQLEEESSDDYVPSDDSDAVSEEIEYEPRKTPKKTKSEAVKNSRPPLSKRIEIYKKSKVSPTKSEKVDSEVAVKEEQEQVDVVTITPDKEQLYGKDKIIQLPNNRTYFEFAEPKKKVILQIKPPYETQELKSQTLSELVNCLRVRNMISTDGQELLEAFKELPDTLQRINDIKSKGLKIYTDEVKRFATVLYVFAPKAYDLVSTIFFLPPKAQLQERLRTKNFCPGLTEQALKILKKADVKDPSEQVCSIMVDFIPIKRECHKVSDNIWLGHVDFCGGPTPGDSDEVPLASEILLLTVVGIGWDWKLPFGYFLSNGLSGEALHSIVIEAIRALEEAGLNVKAVVCDGFSNTIKMGVLFGCNFHTKSFAEIVTSFPHPLDEKRKMHLVFGIRRALVLLRNLLADKTILRSSTYGIIKWKFFERLWGNERKTKYEIRDILNPDHLRFYNLQRILRHCHAAFSSTENLAFELANDLKIEEYIGSTPAVNFVADIFRAFDLLNSRNPVTSGEKPPISNPFLPEQLESMTVIGQRIFGLEFLSGTQVVSDGRWLSAMLFAVTLKSVSVLASELLVEKSVMYLTTYRVNLDHSEMVLSCIQRFGGWEEVPTATEFQTGYKGLLEYSNKNFDTSSFYCDFEGNDYTVGQGIIFPLKMHLPLPTYIDITFNVKFSSLTDLLIDCEAQARCILRCLSMRLTCASCMVLLLEEESSSNLEKKKINVDFAKPSKFFKDLLQISGKAFKSVPILSDLNVEHFVSTVFCEFLSDFWKTFYIQNYHVVEEPQHFISLIKVIIRVYVQYKVRAKKHIQPLKSRF